MYVHILVYIYFMKFCKVSKNCNVLRDVTFCFTCLFLICLSMLYSNKTLQTEKKNVNTKIKKTVTHVATCRQSKPSYANRFFHIACLTNR